MLIAFWYRSPARDQWLWLLAGIPIIWGLRWLTRRRLWTRTPLDALWIIFVLVCLLNVFIAPYRRAPDAAFSFFVLMGRPLLGIALVLYFVEYARERRNIDGLLIATLALASLVAVLALGASQWTTKSDQLQFLTAALPRLGDLLQPFDTGGGFNVNEVAGALAWTCPLLAGLAAYYWQKGHNLRCMITVLSFISTFVALFLGQSRFALVGVLIALTVMIGLLVVRRRVRWTVWGGVLVIAVLEVLIVRNVFTPPGQQTLVERDEASMSGRYDIWMSALSIIRDYPLTGVGLNMFRDARVRALYPAPGFQQPVLPHAHQEWLQIGTDAGLPGLAIFVVLQGVVVWMLYRGYWTGDRAAKALFLGVAGGLFAHGVFGLGDAIAIWDRFAFLFWWLVALGAAQYFLSRHNTGNISPHTGIFQL
jgi:O-antigen ligase